MDHLEAFRAAARRDNQDRERSGWRYSKEARRLAVAYCREERRSGISFSRISESLGITTLTLGRWLEEPEQEPTFHQMEVRELSRPTLAAESLRVVLPSGLAVEGLTLGQVIELARLLP
jgi:hypothetical protein